MYIKSWRKYMIALIKKNYIKENINLKSKNTLRINCIARFYAEPGNVDEIIEAIYFAEKEGLPVLFLGGGSNILLPDNTLEALVISFSGLKEYVITEDGVIADAGVKLSELIKRLSEKGFGGLEFTAGIPATVGGAIRMNLGSMGKEIGEFVEEIFAYENGFFRKVKKEEINFSYRKGYTEGIIISAYLNLKRKDKRKIKQEILNILEKKKKTQPLDMPSAGCVFKNPKDAEPAGKLIEKAGLKGKKIGGAMISEKHANFIVNIGGAKSSDIKRLIQLAENEVYKKFGVKLERELLYAEEILL